MNYNQLIEAAREFASIMENVSCEEEHDYMTNKLVEFFEQYCPKETIARAINILEKDAAILAGVPDMILGIATPSQTEILKGLSGLSTETVELLKKVPYE